MLYDVLFELCSATDVYSNGSSVQSANIIDWGSSSYNKNIGAGNPIYLNIRVATSFSGGTSAQFKYVVDSDTTITNGTTIFETPAIAVASLSAGEWVLRMPLPVNADSARYAGVVVTCVGNVTAGAINAWLDAGSVSDHGKQTASSNVV